MSLSAAIDTTELRRLANRALNYEMRQALYAAAAALDASRAQAEALAEALNEACDVAIWWMSGSSAFALDGEAGEAWLRNRERLYVAMNALAAWAGTLRR